MATEQLQDTAAIRAGRERYVTRGVATTEMTVSRAEGAMTSKLVYKQALGPLAPDVSRAPAPYPYRGVTTSDAIAGLELLFSQDAAPQEVACVVLETVQGEGGFIPMPADFVQALKLICERHGILYVADEVQSGCGRTGPPWAIEHLNVEPDLIVSGKTLGGGLPLAAVTGRAELMDSVHPGGLGGTFGGNPVSCAAACVVLDALAEPGFRARAETVGRLIRGRLERIAEEHRQIGEVRGLRPMLAIEFVEKWGQGASSRAEGPGGDVRRPQGDADDVRGRPARAPGRIRGRAHPRRAGDPAAVGQPRRRGTRPLRVRDAARVRARGDSRFRRVTAALLHEACAGRRPPLRTAATGRPRHIARAPWEETSS